MHIWMDGWMCRWMDGWMYGWMDGSMDGSKIFEIIISKQIIKYLSENELYPINQSAYRKNHSTETAISIILFY